MQPYERLDVYRVALEFRDVAMGPLWSHSSADIKQLERASGSVLNNIAEASVLMPGRNKARIFRLALGEAAESLSLVDRLARRGDIDPLTRNRARSLMERVIRMLRKLSTPPPPTPSVKPVRRIRP